MKFIKMLNKWAKRIAERKMEKKSSALRDAYIKRRGGDRADLPVPKKMGER